MKFFKSKKQDSITFSMPKCISMLFVFLLSVASHAQLSLNQAIERAVQNNGSLKTNQLAIQSQEALVGSGWQLPKLSVDLAAGQTQNRPFDFTLNAMQNFEPFGVYRGRTKVLNQQVNVAKKQQDIQRNELVFNIKQQYYQVLYNHQLVRLLKAQDTLYQRANEAAKIRFKAGETNQLEVVVSETNQREIQNRRFVAERDIQTGYLSLQALLYANEPIVIDTSTKLLRPRMLQESKNRYLALAEEEAQLSRANTSLERAYLKPDWRVGLANQSIEHRFGFTYLAGGIGIPIATKPQKARIEAAQISEQVADNQLKNLQFQIESNQKILNETLNKIQATIQYYEQSALPQTDFLIKTALKQFKLGEIDYVEFFQNIKQASQIREAYLAEQLRFSLTVIELEKWQGIE